MTSPLIALPLAEQALTHFDLPALFFINLSQMGQAQTATNITPGHRYRHITDAQTTTQRHRPQHRDTDHNTETQTSCTDKTQTRHRCRINTENKQHKQQKAQAKGADRAQ